MSKQFTTSRRNVLKTAAGAASLSFLPSCMTSRPEPPAPSDRFNFVQVGCGGKGWSDMNNTVSAGGKLIALCDVDEVRAKKAREKYPKLPFYTDYREMLEKHDKDIDGVVVSTPDHTHACVAMDAIKRSKHVYVQKPLARTYQECQELLEAARYYGVTTQMGNQGHSGDGLKLWQKMQDEKAFGDIEHINTWSNRPVWPQGMTKAPAAQTAPSTLAWDTWLGPVAERSYAKEYLPFNWRGWWDFGAGAMGDMACHNMDPAFWILELGLPTKIKAQASAPAGVAYPDWSIIDYTFEKSPVTGKPITLTWYDGKKLPKMPAGANPSLPAGGNGCMVIGSKMTAMGESHAARPRPIAISKEPYSPKVKVLEKEWRAEAKKLKGDNHYGQWIDAAKAGKPNAPGSSFEYAVPFTQAILLGCIALRYPGQELIWDNDSKEFSNFSEANQWLSFEARSGFDITL